MCAHRDNTGCNNNKWRPEMADDLLARRDEDYWAKYSSGRRLKNQRPKHTKRAVRGDPWQSAAAMELGLRPRHYEEMHSERTYLLNSLQEHDYRALELFSRLPMVEEKITEQENNDHSTSNAEKLLGRLRRDRTWLKQRIRETVEEERNILTRLSEIYVEIQCRVRWSYVEKEREARNSREFRLVQDDARRPSIAPNLWAPSPLFDPLSHDTDNRLSDCLDGCTETYQFQIDATSPYTGPNTGTHYYQAATHPRYTIEISHIDMTAQEGSNAVDDRPRISSRRHSLALPNVEHVTELDTNRRKSFP